MVQAQLNHDMIAVAAGDITVFNFDGETREYLSSSVEYLAAGVGVPANSCIDMPGKALPGFAICRKQDLTGWEYIADHRGETVYSIHSGVAIFISGLGDYPADTTQQVPNTPYDTWNGNEWVTDTARQHAADIDAVEQQKATLLMDAQMTISFWQTELQLGIISDKDKASLIPWLIYIKELQKIDSDAAPDIEWPTSPKQ